MCHFKISMSASTAIRSMILCLLAWCTSKIASRVNESRSGTSNSPLKAAKEKLVSSLRIGKRRLYRTSGIKALAGINQKSVYHYPHLTSVSFQKLALSLNHNKRMPRRYTQSDQHGLSNKSRCKGWSKSLLCRQLKQKAWHRRPLAVLCLKIRWRIP